MSECEAAFARWLDAKASRYVELVAQDVTRQDPHKLAVRRHARLMAAENAKLPLFREPVPSVDELQQWYEERDSPEVAREFYDRINRTSWMLAWQWREDASERLTREQLDALQGIRDRVYPDGAGYSAGFWREVLFALEFCPEPFTASRFEFWDWMKARLGETGAWSQASGLSETAHRPSRETAPGPYDTAAEASGVYQRVKGDRGPEDG